MHRHELTDAQWQTVLPLIKRVGRHHLGDGDGDAYGDGNADGHARRPASNRNTPYARPVILWNHQRMPTNRKRQSLRNSGGLPS
jgi:hypothetical protein